MYCDIVIRCVRHIARGKRGQLPSNCLFARKLILHILTSLATNVLAEYHKWGTNQKSLLLPLEALFCSTALWAYPILKIVATPVIAMVSSGVAPSGIAPPQKKRYCPPPQKKMAAPIGVVAMATCLVTNVQEKNRLSLATDKPRPPIVNPAYAHRLRRVICCYC